METITRPRRINGVIQVKEPGKFGAGLDAMTAGYLGKDVIEGVRPLVQVARSRSSKELRGCGGRAHRTADGINIVLGQSKRRLGIAATLIPVPARRIGARLFEQCGW